MNQTQHTRHRLSLSPLLLAGLVMSMPGMGATLQWDGGAGTGNWQTANNWNPNALNPNYNGSFSDRLNVNGAQELIYSSAEGNTTYTFDRGVVIGSGAAGSGTFRITGGSFSTAGAGVAVLGNTGNTGTMIIDGGSYTGSTAGFSIGLGGGNGILTLNSGSATIPTLLLNSSSGTINLNGGTLTLNTLTFTTGNNRINFNGGTYKMGAATAGFSGFNSANVQAGGAIFDTNGFDATIGQALLDAGGGGGLTKNGAGTLTLTGSANTFTGVTTINAGTLILNKAASTTSIAGNVVIGDNGTGSDTLRVSANEQIADTSVVSFTSGLSGNSALLQLAGGVTETVGGITTTLAGRAPVIEVSSAGTGTLVVNDASNRTYDGILRNGSGTLAFTKQGAGNLTLQNTGGVVATNFSGATTISGGTLTLGSTAGATGNKLVMQNWSSAISNNSALVFDNATGLSETFGQAISGTGTLTKSGAGTVILGVNNTYTGVTTINGGTLSIAADGANGAASSRLGAVPASPTPGHLVLNGGTLSFSATTTFASNRGVLVNASGGTFNNTAGSASTINAIIDGAGAVTFNGAFILGGANTYTGGTTLSGGTGFTTVITNSAAFGGALGGTVTVNNIGLRATTGGDLTIVNPVTLAGTLKAVTLASEKSLIFSGAATLTGNRTITAELGSTDPNKKLVFSGAVGDGGGGFGITKDGAGILVLSGNNTYAGVTTVSTGTLNIRHNNALGSTAGATTISTSAAKLQLEGVGLVVPENLTLGVSSAGGTVENVSGNNTLSGTITRSGPVYFNSLAGKLTVQSNIGNTNNSLNLQGAGDGEISGAITTAYSLTKTGAGTWTLSGANTYNPTLATTVSEGTLAISATGSISHSGNSVVVGNTASTNARFTIASGGTATIFRVQAGTANGAVGAIYNQGSLSVSGVADVSTFALGNAVGGYAYYRHDTANTLSLSEIGIAASGGGDAVVDVLQGTVSGTSWFTINRGSGTQYGQLNVTAGTFTLPNSASQASLYYGNAGSNGQAVINVSGTGLLNSSGTLTELDLLQTSTSASATSILNIGSGGLVELAKIKATQSAGTALVNFDGGTLKATTSGVTLLGLGNIDAAYIYSGGVTVDTNGKSVAISEPLLAPTGNGVSSIPVSVNGTGYVGRPNVVISGGGGTGATATAIFDPTTGLVTGFTITNPGTGYTSAPTVTISGGGGVAPTLGTVTTAANVSGGLTKTGAGTLTLTGTSTYTGTTHIAGGTLVVADGSQFGPYPGSPVANSITFSNGAVLQASAAGQAFGPNRGITLAGDGTLESTATFMEYRGKVTGPGELTLDFPGSSESLWGLNTSNYSGGTILSANTKLLVYNNSVGSASTANLTQGPFGTGTLTINNGVSIRATTNNAVTIGNAVTLQGNLTIGSAQTQLLTFNGPITLTGASRTITTNASGTTWLSGNIGEASAGLGLTKSGTGQIIVSGSNTYTGITTVSGGVLRLQSANALPGGIGVSGGTSALTFNGGVIGLNSGDFNRNLAAAGVATGVNFTGAGGWAGYGVDRVVNLNNDSHAITWGAANTGFNGQTLILGASVATSMVDFQNPVDLGAATRTVQVDNGSATVDGKLSGVLSGTGGSLTKTGAGTLQLTAANTFTGVAAVSAGTLQLSDGGTLDSASGVTIGSTSTLSISNTPATATTNRIQDGAPITMTGGTLAFSHTAGAADYSETLGALTVSNTGNVISASRAASGQTSTLNFASLSYTPGGLQFQGEGLGLSDERNRIFISGLSAGAIGSGVTYFDGVASGTAGYSLANGVVLLAPASSVNILGGMIVDNSTSVGIVDGGTSGDITLSSPITAIQSLAQNATSGGTVDLAGRTLRAETIVLGNADASLIVGATPGSGTLTPAASAGSLTLNNNYGSPTLLTINAVIANHGPSASLIKTGAGTVQIAAGATYTGATVISAGTLALVGAGALSDGTAVNLSNAGSVLDISGISASGESIGTLSGVAGSSVVLGGKNLTTLGGGTTFAGVISGAGGSLTHSTLGGTLELTGLNTFTGPVTLGTGAILSVNQLLSSGPQPLGEGTSAIQFNGNAGNYSALVYSGTVDGFISRELNMASGDGGMVSVSDPGVKVTLTGALTGSSNVDFRKDGPGKLVLAGSEDWNGDALVQGGTLVIGDDINPGTNSFSGGTWSIASGATMRINTTGSFEASSITRSGTFNLEAGTLRTNNIAGNGTFTWGNATLGTLGNNLMGTVDRTDPAGSPSGPLVREGNILVYTGALTTEGTSGAGSLLDLGSTVLNDGLRYNQISISGALDLSGVDSLNFSVNPYFLRPTTPDSIATGDWGSLILVRADSIADSFDTITGIGNDSIGWRAFTPGLNGDPAFTSAGDLPLNTYYIEYATNSPDSLGVLGGPAILFHYKVAGSVPEPESVGLMIAGALLLRHLRFRPRKS